MAKASKGTSKEKSAKKSTSLRSKISPKKVLKKEVNLPIREPKSKVGKFVGKKRRIRAPKYFRDSWKELKKVTWPSRKDAIKLSFAVVAFTVVVALFTTIVDAGFQKVVERIFS